MWKRYSTNKDFHIYLEIFTAVGGGFMRKLSFGMIYEVGLAILVILSLTLDLSTQEGVIFD